MTTQITYDPIYNAVGPTEFPAMLDVERYGHRTSAFDQIISATHDHFWDPMDPAYVRFDQPFDTKEQTILPTEMIPELHSAVAEKLDEGQKIKLANESARWTLSSILHGEQGALSLSASLCLQLRDPGAQEYASNQVREEARHVTAFARYMDARWGSPLPVGATLGNLLNDIVGSEEIYKKLIGMQMLVEGLAMGAFATLHSRSHDPLLVKVTQLVMTDEAFHHKFGRIWAERTIPHLNEDEHAKVEDWAAQCFQTLLFNLVNAEQKQVIYREFGLDWQWVRAAVMESFGDADRRRLMKQSNNIFRVLIKTLLHAGIITDRTKSLYAMWVDMDELASESGEMVGDPIAEEGIEYLRDINRNRKRIGKALKSLDSPA